MKTITLIFTLLVVTTILANNNGEKPKSFSITGRVIDNVESLTGVKVMLDNQEMIVYTDFEGNFTINNVVEGEHTLSFSLITYNNKVITFNPTSGNKVEVELEEK